VVARPGVREEGILREEEEVSMGPGGAGGTVDGRGRAHWLVRLLPGIGTRSEAREALWAYVLLSPWLVGLLVFWAGPLVVSLLLAFTEYNLPRTPTFVGLANFRLAFSGDRLFWPSLRKTFYFAGVYVPFVVTGSLLLAILLNQKVGGTNIFRTLFFLPHLTPAVALAVLWRWLLHPQMGPVNEILKGLGWANPPGWLTSPTWAMPAIIIMTLWAGLGGNRMLIYLAGLQGVPEELYEAAEIDGAGTWARFRNVTLPMMSPVIFFNVVLGVIGALQVFTTAFVATRGGPAYATWFFSLHIYNQAFRYYRLGYGSVLAWMLGIILIGFTYFQVKLSERWVYYAAS
jgi:multiple sugar transport system permease protein